MGEMGHSVVLDQEKCIGCTNCVRYCPTEAIRIRGGKAKIINDRCIDCGECIRICPQHAKAVRYDRIAEVMPGFKYKVALVAPTFFGQFKNLDSVGYLTSALKKIGFDMVFDVARAAELVTGFTREYLDSGRHKKLPVISSACPVVVRLIRARFPDLIPNVLPALAPVELAAKMARKEAAEASGLSDDEIGCFFISPCPAKVTAAKNPFFTDKSGIDAVLSMRKVYLKVLPMMTRESEEEHASSGIIGISWATSGGEASALLRENYLAADGIRNVIKVLGEIENDNLSDLEFVELNACTGGCVGGVMTVENPFVARARIKNLRKYMPVSRNFYDKNDLTVPPIETDKKLSAVSVLNLGGDPAQALAKMNRISQLTSELPGFDCGSCGSPTCRALAEDAVLGFASTDDCIFGKNARQAGLFTEEKSGRFKENNT